MSTLNPDDRNRLLELLADERFAGLSPEDRGQLESLAVRAQDASEFDQALGELLIALDSVDGSEGMPRDARDRVAGRGRGLLAPDSFPIVRPHDRPGRRLFLVAAIITLVSAVGVSALFTVSRAAQLNRSRATIADLREQIEQNGTLLAETQTRLVALRAEIESSGEALDAAHRALAEESARRIDLATQLADATEDLDRALLKVARFEQPTDPAELQLDRRKLLDMPDTVRIAWAPFDLPDAPAEQGDVTGDVVWNDELQSGYLRFVGLDVNDPDVEQYQVWIIDDRGLEQKVSGGVFNATAQGEVIVPIDPGIDVRRVALFAVTIEEPGGTWVPDLARRVVVAPRDG